MRLLTHKIVSIAIICVLVSCPPTTSAQVFRAVERASARAARRAVAERAATKSERAAMRAERAAASRRRVPRGEDAVVKRWSSSLCKPARPCPLPENVANNFSGGSYKEVVLARDTVLYRVYHSPKVRLGVPGKRFSYWSRSDARGLQAAIDGAIPVSRNGNVGDKRVAIRVPRGTHVYEGRARGDATTGTAGGGDQVVVDRVRPEWQWGR